MCTPCGHGSVRQQLFNLEAEPLSERCGSSWLKPARLGGRPAEAVGAEHSVAGDVFTLRASVPAWPSLVKVKA